MNMLRCQNKLIILLVFFITSCSSNKTVIGKKNQKKIDLITMHLTKDKKFKEELLTFFPKMKQVEKLIFTRDTISKRIINQQKNSSYLINALYDKKKINNLKVTLDSVELSKGKIVIRIYSPNIIDGFYFADIDKKNNISEPVFILTKRGENPIIYQHPNLSHSNLKFTTQNKDSVETKYNSYKITKIDSINDWYVIYAKRGKNVYKIVSKKEKNCSDSLKIKVGNAYKFHLISRKHNPLKIGNIVVKPQNSLDIQCYSYDKDTEICIEIENGIYDLYNTDNLIGLCYKN